MGSQYSTKRESFHDAILKKDLKKVKYFIQNGLDVKNDLRALELATYRGSTDIVEYLLHRGCKPNNKRTARAFDIAVWKCHKEIAQLFLKAGIEYKGKNIYQETILFVAACSNNTALTEILIESGCDMNETTRLWAPLHAAAARNHEQTLETLIKHGCDVNIKDKDGLNALAHCIRNENMKSIRLLIKCGCKIDMNMINSNESLRTQLIKYPQIEQIFNKELTTVKSLKEISRLYVRKCLDQRLLAKVVHLPIPQTLRDYVSMIEIFGSSTRSSSNLHVDSVTSSNNKNEDYIQSDRKKEFDVIKVNHLELNKKIDRNNRSSQQSFLLSKSAVERAARIFLFKKRSS